jgi:hypothetical protein
MHSGFRLANDQCYKHFFIFVDLIKLFPSSKVLSEVDVGAESREQRAESREQRAESREQRAERREQS